jgi:hypothetical protein
MPNLVDVMLIIFALVSFPLGHAMGYRTALRLNKSLLRCGRQYRDALDKALCDCRPGQRAEVTLQVLLPEQPERRGSSPLGTHVVPGEAETR